MSVCFINVCIYLCGCLHVSLTIACLLWFNDMYVCVLHMCMCVCKYVSPIFLTMVHLNDVYTCMVCTYVCLFVCVIYM